MPISNSRFQIQILGRTTVFFTTEETKETSLNFSEGSVKVAK